VQRLPDSELSRMIDEILTSDDLNDNGLIEYPEFVIAVRKRQER
jgi:hypothetical protein